MEDFIKYELNRKLYINKIENSFDINREELLILSIIKEINTDKIYLSELLYHINKYNLYYTKHLKSLRKKNYFTKKRLPEDERSVIIQDINYEKIEDLFDDIYSIVFDTNEKNDKRT
ncbi:transcriptional regulator, SarA/Rot family [Mammaliicoccus sciuri]|uniref:transcriptional regulator, SarA/Rot family n=1 Tax=Mammaliicoccus sciuri TaxID=1296 RepID=UPI002DB65751|nr:hypothetical protein [Mammaliicoccus sciuri]MEB7784181.1 hypothetical protein [Mammaliicoccus sciuri]